MTVISSHPTFAGIRGWAVLNQLDQIACNQPNHSTFKGRTKEFAARLAKAKALV